MERIYVGHVAISSAMATKIRSKDRGVEPWEVEDLQGRTVQARRVWDAERGTRYAVLHEALPGRTLKILLKPIDVPDGTYRLCTAFLATRE